MKPGNAGGGKGPWFRTDARRSVSIHGAAAKSRYWHFDFDRPVPVGRKCSMVRLYFAPRKSTSVVSIVPAFRPGAACEPQYRFVCAMTLSGGGAPQVV
jgi:hypothetical protein